VSLAWTKAASIFQAPLNIDSKGDATWQTARNARILRALVKFNRKNIAARNAKRWKKLRISTAVATIRDAVAEFPEL
jgi:hypothetical protein